MAAIQEQYLDLDAKNCAKYTMAVAVMLTGVAAHRIRRFEEAGIFKPKRTGINKDYIRMPILELSARFCNWK